MRVLLINPFYPISETPSPPLGLAYLAPKAITATVSMNIQAALTPDGSVVGFALLLSTLAAVIFGTAPAWSLSRTDVNSLLQRPGHGRTRARFRGGLVVIQEIFGVNPHIRSVVDRYASFGYRAIAPALFDRVERNVELVTDDDDPCAWTFRPA